MSGSDEPLVFKPQRGILAGIASVAVLLLLAMFLGVPWFLIWGAAQHQKTKAQVVFLLVLGIVWSLLLLIPLYMLLARSYTEVTINKGGLLIRRLLRRPRLLAWSEITQVRLWRHPHAGLVALIRVRGSRWPRCFYDSWFPVRAFAEEVARRAGVPLFDVHHAFPADHCQQCGYNLTGNVSRRCPECGKRI